MYIVLIILVILFFAATLLLNCCLYRTYKNYVQLLNEIKMLKSIIEWQDNKVNNESSKGG